VEEAARNTACLAEFDRLLRQYEVYLPSELLEKLDSLRWQCWSLSSNPGLNGTYRAINLLFEVQNLFRQYVGVDRLSQDLMKALGRQGPAVPRDTGQPES
jgi:hypothetical protein